MSADHARNSQFALLRQRRFDNRVAWAKVYLEQAGLLRSPKRGQLQITAEGLAI